MKRQFSEERDSLIRTCLVLNALIFLLFSLTVMTWFTIVIRQRRNAEVLKTDNANLEKLVEQKGKQLVQSSKLASIGEMSAGVAHEINNPLSVIYYGLELMEKSQGDAAKVTAHIEKLKRAIRRLSTCQLVINIGSGTKIPGRSACGFVSLDKWCIMDASK